MNLNREALVAAAMLAPSVHNVQPARWRLVGDDGLVLFEDEAVRLTVGDPTGHDAAISLGAAAEGLRLAAGVAGLGVEDAALPDPEPGLRPVAAYRLVANADVKADPLAALIEARRSWRGAFVAPNAEDRAAAMALGAGDVKVIGDPDALRQAAVIADQASFHFMRRRDFRGELLSWMRLSRRHARWDRDGLNADAMAMGRAEAIGAGLVLGPLFGLLDGIGLAEPILRERAKTQGAAGLLLFHRPIGEDPFVSGAAFYRCWLRIEAAGFGAAVIAALADHRPSAERLAAMAGIGRDRRLVSTFRIGRRPAGAQAPRARRPIAEVLV